MVSKFELTLSLLGKALNQKHNRKKVLQHTVLVENKEGLLQTAGVTMKRISSLRVTP